MINRKLSRRLYWSQLRYCQLQGQSPYSSRPVSAPSRIALNTYAGAEPVQFYQEVRRRARNFISKEEVGYIRKAQSTFRNRRDVEVKTFKRPLEALSFLENKGTSGTSIKQLIEKIARRRARSQIAFEIEKKKLEGLAAVSEPLGKQDGKSRSGEQSSSAEQHARARGGGVRSRHGAGGAGERGGMHGGGPGSDGDPDGGPPGGGFFGGCGGRSAACVAR